MEPLKTAPTPESKLHFLDYWRIIRIRKTVILAVFLLVVITATVVTMILPESFASTAKIKVDRDVSDVASLGGGQQISGVYDPYFIQTEFEIIQSPLVLDQVIDNLGLGAKWTKKFNMETPLKLNDTRTILGRQIELRPTRNTSLIEIRVYSDNKDEAAEIANEIAKSYAQYRQDQRKRLTENGIKIFLDEIRQQSNEVARLEKVVDNLRQESGIVDSDPQSIGPSPGMEPQTVMHINSLKIEQEMKFLQSEKTLTELKRLPAKKLRQAIPTTAPDGLLNMLLQDLLTAQTKLVSQRSDLGELHPDVVRTMNMVKDIDSKIDDRVEGILIGMEANVAALKAAVDGAELKLTSARSNDMKVARESREYFRQKQELDRLKKFRDVLSLRTLQEKIDVIIPKSNMVTLVGQAEPNPRPVRPNRTLNIALGIIIGLVVGVGLAFFIEYLDTSVKTIDDLERSLQAPVLGVIPQNVGYLMEEGAESPHAEAYRVLRTNLLFSRKDDKLNTIAVVSAGAGEGKSTTVYNLATVFAQSGQRVLMVDSDLRRPTLHKLLNVTNSLGLTNYLLKQNTLEEVIQTTGLGNLDLLASGKLPSSSLGILSSAQMKNLISELKQRYDFVFFDSPPIMGVSDASILASEVDMTLQVIQYRRYPQPMNIRAKQLIEKVGGNLMGIVLNNINMSQDESYYYYSGYYHDYYSKNEASEPVSPGGKNGAGAEKPRTDGKSKF